MKTGWLFLLAFLLIGIQRVQAHFLWLVPLDESGSKVTLYFSEGPEPDNPALLAKLAHVQATPFRTAKASEPVSFEFTADKQQLQASLGGASAWTLTHTYGVHGREEKSLLIYTASSVACRRPGMFDKDSIELPHSGFTLEPEFDGKVLTLKLFSDDQPATDFEFDLQAANDHRTMKTDDKGVVQVEDVQPGVYAIRCRKIEATPGEHEGTAYASVKRYTTVSFIVPDLSLAHETESKVAKTAELPAAITSFGSAKVGQTIYVYGGHTGAAHSYSNEEQFNKLIALNPTTDSEWKQIAEGPKVQGNALVSTDRSVILVGGFCAENAEGEKSRLVSKPEVLEYDLEAKSWTKLPDLPEPRSSMDAICIDGYVYVAGGWSMNGNSDETKWLNTAYRLSLKDKAAGWQAIATPPFKRRAVALAGHDHKLYVLGGMDEKSGPSTEVYCFDPKADKWSQVGSLAGVPMNGFGAAALEVDGKLYTSTADGSIQKFDDATSTWKIAGQIAEGRFFHRAVGIDDHAFVLIGGANMEIGKFKELEFISVKP